ncbi:MAG: hypothetical protein JSW37_12910 [Anaerolineales bacterium]|nr:MAG: hypothetical protein JSW37_12910 [Anaerolineales bacterium]
MQVSIFYDITTQTNRQVLLVLGLDIVSSPWSELNSDLVEHHRYDGGDAVVDVWQLLPEVSEGSW